MELETEQNCNILAPTLMAISVVSFSFSRVAQPDAQLSAGCWLSYHILSPKLSDLQTPQSRVPRAPFCRVLAFSTTFYLQLSDLHTAQLGVPRTPSAGCWLTLPLTDFLSSPSYIIVQSPTQYLPITGHRNMHFRRLLNGMFYRHQAEITVMQFTGHFLLVH